MNDSPYRTPETPEQKSSWRKQILRQMMHGLKRPLITEKGWELLYNKHSGEYSFMIGNTILFINGDGNPDVTKILDNGRVRASSQKEKMVRLLDKYLEEYAEKHNLKTSDGEEDDEDTDDVPTGLTVDVQPENPPEESAPGVIRKIRRRLHL